MPPDDPPRWLADLEADLRRHAAALEAVCPHCGTTDGYLNVGSEHWGVCDRDGTRWRIGADRYADWRGETPADWDLNRTYLQGYRVVEPRWIRPEDAPEGPDLEAEEDDPHGA
jgi:hypothetical protein